MHRLFNRVLRVLVGATLTVLCACEKPQIRHGRGSDEPRLRQPTASEVFNLRSQCAKLGSQINEQHDLTFRDYYEAMDEPVFLEQEEVSHYDPKTNRCYVELEVTVSSVTGADAATPALGHISNAARRFLKTYEIGYLERRLFDGQTGEELAVYWTGLSNGQKWGFLKDAGIVPTYRASTYIDDRMEDDRTQ